MKKNDKNFETKFNKDLEQYFNNIEVPELSISKQEELKRLVKQNKPKRKKFALWQRITAFAGAVCLLALILIPTIISLNKNDTPKNPPATPPTYYGKAEATKIQHTLDETQTIISSTFPKYNFMFNDLSYKSSMGFYNPENNSLLALQITFNETEIPFATVEIHIIASKQFVFDNKESYTSNAEFTQTEEYKLYKKTSLDAFNEFQTGFIIFENHEIYINFERINEELFNKFI